MKTTLLICLLPFLSQAGDGPDKQPAPSMEKKPASAPKPVSPEQVEKAQQAELMRAVFGKRYDASRAVAVADLPNPEDRELEASHVVSAVSHTVLPTGETLLVANAVPADLHGEPMVFHVTGGLLNIYVLRKQEGRWRVLKRHENIDELGSSGNLGSVQWAQPGQGKTGLAILHGGLWQGSIITHLSLYDVSRGKVRPLTKDFIKVQSSNGGACMATSFCWEVEGDWTFVAGKPGAEYDDLLVRFSGEESEPVREYPEGTDEADVERTKKSIQGQARYRFDGKQYTLIEGENLVPDV